MVLPQVGKAKLGLLKGEHVLSQSAFRDGKGPEHDPVDSYIHAIKEKEKPSFNVLYVESQRPSILNFPVVKGLVDTVLETIDLVRPVLRMGLPRTSVKDKCPHYRPITGSDASHASMKLSHEKQQKVMRSIEDQSLFNRPHHHLPHSHFYLHEPPALGMVAINLVALYGILNYKG